MRITQAILRDQKTALSVSSLINDYCGISDVCFSLPTVIDCSGIDQVLRIQLNQDEEQKLRRRRAQRYGREAQARVIPRSSETMFSLIATNLYSAITTAVLFVHALFILWIIFGAALTGSRRILQTLHIISLLWGILTELLPWSCPLTIAENWLESRAGVQPYHGGFLLHYLDALVYPDISPTALTAAGVIVCLGNLALYARRFWRTRRSPVRMPRLPGI